LSHALSAACDEGGGPRQQDFGAQLKVSTAAPFRA
jgi:hypothetical protein